MCICSNTWSSQCRAVLTRLGIDEYFDFYIEARGAMSKSSPAPFMEALHRLGGTSPAGCAVCEDAIYAAQTAHDAGFYLVGIQDVSSAADAPAPAPGMRPVPAGLDRAGLGAGVIFPSAALL